MMNTMVVNLLTRPRTRPAPAAAAVGRPSAPTTGSGADKRREKREPDNKCSKAGRALVACCTDRDDLTKAAKYDLPLSGWRALRDEALLARGRLLEANTRRLATGTDSTLEKGDGVTIAAAYALEAETDDYAAYIVASADASANRSALTADLPRLAREAALLFDQVKDLLPQSGGTPAGDAFVAAYLACTIINDRRPRPQPQPRPRARARAGAGAGAARTMTAPQSKKI